MMYTFLYRYTPNFNESSVGSIKFHLPLVLSEHKDSRELTPIIKLQLFMKSSILWGILWYNEKIENKINMYNKD